MELAKLTANRQVTIPLQIRQKLKLKEGDKIMFIEKGDTVQIVNSSVAAIFTASMPLASRALLCIALPRWGWSDAD